MITFRRGYKGITKGMDWKDGEHSFGKGYRLLIDFQEGNHGIKVGWIGRRMSVMEDGLQLLKNMCQMTLRRNQHCIVSGRLLDEYFSVPREDRMQLPIFSRRECFSLDSSRECS